ncbi:hypothetical protein ACYTTR_00090 [Cobetia marina]
MEFFSRLSRNRYFTRTSSMVFGSLEFFAGAFFGFLIVVYLIGMFLVPWVNGGFSWNYLQSVWYRWQGLNVGVLAFMSSIIIYISAKYSAEAQRKREFEASKAFLSDALSELVGFYKKSASQYDSVWNGNYVLIDIGHPNKYRNVFKDCIRHSDPYVSSFLYNYLVDLQVHNARLSDIREYVSSNSVYSSDMLASNLLLLGKLYAATDRLFDIARNESYNLHDSLALQEYMRSYRLMNVDYDKVILNGNSLRVYVETNMD